MNLPALAHAQALVVSQQKEWSEIFTGWDARNRYVIDDGSGGPPMLAAETGGGVGSFLARGFLSAARPFTIEIGRQGGHTEMVVQRPFTLLFARATVLDGTGRVLGTVRQRFALLSRRFTIEDADGNELAELHGPWFRPWTFRVLVAGAEVGVIRKQWSGLGREMFTRADDFGLEMSSAMSPALRAVCLGATFLIDFVYFERKR